LCLMVNLELDLIESTETAVSKNVHPDKITRKHQDEEMIYFWR
jgi:hypothetical protein